MKIVREREKYRLGRGFLYNRAVGNWWLARAADHPHRRAYANIANFVRRSIPRDPRLIVDYACGPGNLLSLLCRRFPRSLLLGLDGSSLLLDRAEQRLSRLPQNCSQRISLIETSLPAPVPMRRRADLAVFCFPNMMPPRLKKKTGSPGIDLGTSDREIARYLSRMREPLSRDVDTPNPRDTLQTLEYARSISKNLRSLMVRGGICVRAEYATTRRHEWSALELLHVSFEEGSLDTIVNGIRPQPWFRVLASAYFHSRVLEDVYHQTADSRDAGGGYLITVLRAL